MYLDRRDAVAGVGILPADHDARARDVRDQHRQPHVRIAPLRHHRRIAQQRPHGGVRGRRGLAQQPPPLPARRAQRVLLVGVRSDVVRHSDDAGASVWRGTSRPCPRGSTTRPAPSRPGAPAGRCRASWRRRRSAWNWPKTSTDDLIGNLLRRNERLPPFGGDRRGGERADFRGGAWPCGSRASGRAPAPATTRHTARRAPSADRACRARRSALPSSRQCSRRRAPLTGDAQSPGWCDPRSSGVSAC